MDKGQTTDMQNINKAPAIAPNSISIFGRPDIPTIFIDKFIFTKRSEGTILVSGIQSIPGVEIEQLRFLISEDHAKRLLDSLAKLADYYPVKGVQPNPTPVVKERFSGEEEKSGKKTKKIVLKKKRQKSK